MKFYICIKDSKSKNFSLLTKSAYTLNSDDHKNKTIFLMLEFFRSTQLFYSLQSEFLFFLVNFSFLSCKIV